jgi:DNA-binding GntR family transcriptional regulator
MDVYQIIKDRILFLEYPPGQLLNEKVLTEELGIKRWALRKALFQLETDKLIKIMPRLGSIVTDVEFQKLRDVYQIRVVVEGLIGRLSAQKISDQQLHEMEKLKESCKKAGNSKQLINIDIDFRKVLNDSAKNPHLAEISDSLYNLTLRVWYLVFDSNNISIEADQAMQEYKETIRVLRKREPQAAEKLRQNIIKKYVERIKSVF